MTIPELLNAAYIEDPTTTFTAFDRFDYGVGWTAPGRKTHLTVWKPGASHEAIALEMDGDQVVAIKPGSSVLHWQVTPLLRAFHGWKVPA